MKKSRLFCQPAPLGGAGWLRLAGFAVGLVLSCGALRAQVPPLTLGLVTCQAVAVPPVVRAQGVAELIGDIFLTCTNTPPAGNSGPLVRYLVTSASVSLNVNVANDVDFGAGADISDAILQTNENHCESPSATGNTFGTCPVPDPEFQVPQYGKLAAVNRLEWSNVAIPVPGAPRAGKDLTADCSQPGNCFPFVTTLRFTSIRANASQLGVPTQATFPSTQITAFVSIGGPPFVPVTNNVLNVATPILDAPESPGTLDLTHPPVACTATAVPPVVRAEGIAELVGDIVLTCLPLSSDYTYPTPRSTLDFGVWLNVNVTNRVGFSAPNVADAVLVVNENNCMTPASIGGTYSCGNGVFQDPQFGRLAASNRLEWDDVRVPVPGVDPDGGGPAAPHPSVTTVRITSMRSNASQLGVPDEAVFPSTQITAFVSISGCLDCSPLAITNNVLNVAVPIRALLVEVQEPSAGGPGTPPPFLQNVAILREPRFRNGAGRRRT